MIKRHNFIKIICNIDLESYLHDSTFLIHHFQDYHPKFNQFPWQLIKLLFLSIFIKFASQFQREATKNPPNHKMLFLLLAPLIDLAFNAAIPLVHSDRDVQLMLILLVLFYS